EAKKDLDKMKGTWKVASGERNGAALANEDPLKTLILTVAGDKYTAKVGDENEAGTIKLDPSKKPKQIDLSITEGQDKGKKQFGLYSIEGDTLKVCFAPTENERPKDMTAKEGTDNILITLKREK